MSPRKVSYREAARVALRKALQRDPKVFLMGEDVGRYGGSYAVSAFYELDAAPVRVCSAEVPLPYAAHLEHAAGKSCVSCALRTQTLRETYRARSQFVGQLASCTPQMNNANRVT